MEVIETSLKNGKKNKREKVKRDASKRMWESDTSLIRWEEKQSEKDVKYHTDQDKMKFKGINKVRINTTYHIALNYQQT